MAKNKIMLRLQNLADSLDTDSSTEFVNKTMIVEAMWKSQNDPDATMKSYRVTEKSITGN